MRFNQYSYARTKRENMLTELAELGFFYDSNRSDKENLEDFLRTSFFTYKNTDHPLKSWAADSQTDLLSFFQSDRELTASVFYTFPLHLETSWKISTSCSTLGQKMVTS